MNRDVFLSLLALDAYNRGYGQNVLLNAGDSMDGQVEAGRRLGNALVRGQSNVLPGSDAVNAGFYAIAYDWQGERVISYRGTNFEPPSSLADFYTSPLIKDAWNGWRIGAGYNDSSQAGLAIAFYEDVVFGANAAGLNIFDRNEAGVTLTGHSLGASRVH